MKLRISHHPDSGSPVNLQVTADATTTAGALASALARGPGADAEVVGAERLSLRVTQQSGRTIDLAPGQLLVNSGLVSGSSVALHHAARRTASHDGHVATLTVAAGASVGAQARLGAGKFRIGRADDCDVTLSDPQVSKHHALIDVRDGLEIIDTNSANGVVVGGVRVQRATLRQGDTVRLGDTTLEVSFLREAPETVATSNDLAFVRSPRVLTRRAEQTVDLPRTPQEADPTRFPWLAMVAPLIMGGVLYAVTRSPLSLVFVALSPLLMLGNWWGQRTEARRKQRKEAEAFTRQLAAADERLGQIHALEREQLQALHPSVSECIDEVKRLGPVLWSRRPEHPEFLQVRLGTGDIPPMVAIGTTDPGGETRFTEPRDAVVARWATLKGAPVVADLRVTGGLGISGAPGLAEGVSRALVAQVVTLHAPSEVVLACLTSAAGRARWSWVEWLPHAASPHSPFGPLQLSSDAGTGRLLLDRLEELVEVRRGGENAPAALRGPTEDATAEADAPVLPAVVVVVDEPPVDLGRLTRLAERGPDVGVHVLWVASDHRQVPAACRAYLDLGDGTRAKVGLVREGFLVAPVSCESLDTGTALWAARSLAPVVDVGAPVEDESDLPRAVSVVSLLGADVADDADQILARWRENGSLVDRTSPQPRERAGDLRAIIGHTGTDPFTLDLRSQGPHALVGGTTGSGKSEFLQAWVLGLAHAYSPDRLTFLFVDYKGGAAFSQCTKLPHSVGMVTDLSAYLVRRALRSLRAEIQYREHLFHEKQVKDLIDFELKGDPACPPSLVIVVDEFAALKSEVPEFVEGVVDVAQRGRSLGLHLIMATQRPAGVITDSLRANTNLRVALRMNDEHDSADVLGTPLAARFDPSIPGRGAARTGPGRITAFQSAFPGARTYAQPPAPPIEVVELDFGMGRPWKVEVPTASGPKPEKDIVRVVGAVAQAAERGGVRPPRRPWRETLAPAYNLELLSQRSDAELVLGVMDDPDHQTQVTQHFRPDAEGNIVFAGSGGSGKTTALRTLAIASGFTARGGPVHVYGIDFGGGGLSMLEPLPYVGSIVMGDDEERIGRLIRRLTAMIEEREPRYKLAGQADTLSKYRENSGRKDEPRVLLLLDGFQTFRAEYDASVARSAVYTGFQKILAQGRGVGIHVAMTVDRTASVPNAMAATFQKKVVLRQTDEDGYLMAGVPKDVLTPASPPGRGMLTDNPQELQLAILGKDGTPGAQDELVKQMAAEIGAFHTARPEPIRSLPLNVLASSMPDSAGGLPVLGVENVSLAPFGFDPSGPVIVAGPPQSGRTSAMRWLAEAIRRWSPDTALVRLGTRQSPLEGAPIWTASMTGGQHVQEYVTNKLLPYLREPAGGRPVVAVFVEQYAEFSGTPAETLLAEAAVLARRHGHPFFVEGEASSFGGFQSFLTEVRQARTGLVLQPDTNDGDNLFRTPFGPTRRSDFPPGRGFWVRAGKVVRVQIPMLA